MEIKLITLEFIYWNLFFFLYKYLQFDLVDVCTQSVVVKAFIQRLFLYSNHRLGYQMDDSRDR